jgi:hypothetical protein
LFIGAILSKLQICLPKKSKRNEDSNGERLVMRAINAARFLRINKEILMLLFGDFMARWEIDSRGTFSLLTSMR